MVCLWVADWDAAMFKNVVEMTRDNQMKSWFTYWPREEAMTRISDTVKSILFFFLGSWFHKLADDGRCSEVGVFPICHVL